MKSPQKILLPVAGFITIAASGLVIAHVSAATNQDTNSTPSLAQRLADKFHLNKTDVQLTIDQYHKDRMQKMDDRYEARLDQAVKDGEITAEQKTKILTEHNKLKAELMAAKDDENSDPKATFQKVKDEANQWSKDNNIDVKWLLPAFGSRHHGPGPGMMAPEHSDEN